MKKKKSLKVLALIGTVFLVGFGGINNFLRTIRFALKKKK